MLNDASGGRLSIACYGTVSQLISSDSRYVVALETALGAAVQFLVCLLYTSIIAISILVNSLLTWDTVWMRLLLKLLLLPVVVGVGYEYIMYAGKHDNVVTRIFSAPGLWMQRITTKEPDDSQMEVAIVSIKSALPSEFAGFEVPLEEKVLAEPVKGGEGAAE